MIERFYLQNNLSFQKVELEFQSGLILFTGPSGAGKSVLLNSILGTLGQKETGAKLSEVIFNRAIDLDEFGIESDEITLFKQIKRDKLRYFINNQTASKKVVSKVGELFINHLNPREIKEFTPENLLQTLDKIASFDNEEYEVTLDKYRELFNEFEQLNRTIKRLELQIREMEEKEDFIKFEIGKIDKIAPKSGEDEELQLTKKRLSKKDRIETYLEEVETIFEKKNLLIEVFDLMGYEDESEVVDQFFEDMRAKLDDINEELSELDDVDVEALLDRIERVSELRNKYGSIDKAIEYRDSKIDELNYLQELRQEKDELLRVRETLQDRLQSVATDIRKNRLEAIPLFEERLNEYLHLLNLGVSTLLLDEREFWRYGVDLPHLKIANIDIDSLSYGEQNRVRLAILTLKTKFGSNEHGTLFLDEIDANLSGEESMRVAKVLKELSKAYQVFAISHQPQLTAGADQHFLVYKESGESVVKELKTEESRADEIIRMIGGELSDSGVRSFALNLLKNL
jgi:DNA repair protein RecN (Recombination protein N)